MTDNNSSTASGQAVVGVHVEETHVSAECASVDGEHLASVSQPRGKRSSAEKAIVDIVLRACAAAGPAAADLRHVTVGAGTLLVRRPGRPAVVPDEDYHRSILAARLSVRLGTPVQVLDPFAVVATAEARTGAGRGVRHLAVAGTQPTVEVALVRGGVLHKPDRRPLPQLHERLSTGPARTGQLVGHLAQTVAKVAVARAPELVVVLSTDRRLLEALQRALIRLRLPAPVRASRLPGDPVITGAVRLALQAARHPTVMTPST